jgi:hypothetical protein
MADRKREVIAAFQRLVTPEDCELEAPVTDRLVVAVACMRLSDCIMKEFLDRAFVVPPVFEFNQPLGHELSNATPPVAPVPAPQPEVFDDSQASESDAFALAKFYFSFCVTDADVEGEAYHGKALLVRVCARVASRLMEKYAVKVNFTGLQQKASLEALAEENAVLLKQLEESAGVPVNDVITELEVANAKLEEEKSHLELKVQAMEATSHFKLEEVQKEHDQQLQKVVKDHHEQMKKMEATLVQIRDQKDRYYLLARAAEEERDEMQKSFLTGTQQQISSGKRSTSNTTGASNAPCE